MSNLYFVIPDFDKKYSPLKKILYPFSNEMYVLIIVIFLAVFIMHHFLPGNFREILMPKQKIPIYQLVVSSLGSQVDHIPPNSFARFIIICWIVLFLIIRTAYCSFLYHFIRSNIKVVPPNDIPSVLENFQVFSTDIMYNLLEYQPEIQSKLIHEDVPKGQIFWKAFLSEHGTVAFLMNIELYGFAKTRDKWVRTHMFIVPKKVLAQNYVIYMKKNSLLKRAFDRQILRYISFGLMDKWERKYINVKAFEKAKDDNFKQMIFEDVSGIFAICGGFLCFSCIVFVFEIISMKYVIDFKFLK